MSMMPAAAAARTDAADSTAAAAVEVLIVDDDPGVTRGLCWLLESIRVPSRAFNTPHEFLAALPAHHGPACVVLDLRMPEVSGLETMEQLTRVRADIPIIFLSAHGDVPSAVRAMKLGAVDFLQKPFNPQQFLDCVARASGLARERHVELEKQRRLDSVLSRLSPRERDVFRYLVEGASSKEIGRKLDISYKTVEVHRANVLRKLEVVSARELMLRFRDKADEPAAF
jgi:two-component system response regulator FixJ